MQPFAQDHQAFKQRIQKEKWHPTGLNHDFVQTLDVTRLKQKYGSTHNRHSNPAADQNNCKLSKFHMNKLLQNERMYKRNNFTEAEHQVVKELVQPPDTQSTMLWNDRSFRTNEQLYNEN